MSVAGTQWACSTCVVLLVASCVSWHVSVGCLLALQVKVKMSVEGFLKNNRGINDGADLDPDFMRALYDRIVSNEIKVRAGLTEIWLKLCAAKHNVQAMERHHCIICNPGAGRVWLEGLLQCVQ